jgi:hypothetical protein
MAFDCSEHKQALHGHARSFTISSTSSGKSVYKLAQSEIEQPFIPSPELFSDFPEPGLKGVRLPRIAECATHLELLETFYVLRQRILRSQKLDDAMGVIPQRETKTGVDNKPKEFKDPKLWEKRQIKWPAFIEFAVVRFLAWRGTLQTQPEAQTTEFYLPPVDVLMVWYSLMLNPRLFRSHCQAEPLYKLSMPWRKVHERINNNTWVLSLPAAARTKFETDTGLSADLFAFLEAWPPLSDTTVPRATALTLDGKTNSRQTRIAPVEGHPEIQTYFELFRRASETDLVVQLRGAVFRQTSFIDKMNNHLWIRSPFVSGTLRRAVPRYEKFLELMRVYPGKMFVPTLDIDLVWHTHQCQAHLYAKGTRETVGRFINHDDSIAKPRLKDGSATTRGLWRVRYGTEYRICGCWDCEGLISLLESAEENQGMEDIVKKVGEEVSYYRAVEVARRKGDRLPRFPREVL